MKQLSILLLVLSASIVPVMAQGVTCVADADCNDGNPCTTDACVNLTCTSVAVPDGTGCPDATICNGNETCQAGACTAGIPLHCDDGNFCTDDICGATDGCRHANNNLSCSDGNACSLNDTCNGGLCVGGNTAVGCTACQAVAIVPPEGGTFLGVTNGTSTLAGTCGSSSGSPERVYQWTPTTSGVATFATCGGNTSYDTVLYVRSGACTNGTQVACNDDACATSTGANLASRASVNVTGGQTYFVVVDGYAGRSGNYTLTITPPTVCGNNRREGAEVCDGTDVSACVTGQCAANCQCVQPSGGLPDLIPTISDVGMAFNSTVPAGDVAEGCAESTTGVDLLRFTARVRNGGTADLHLGNPGCPAPCNDHPLEICANPDFICSPAGGHNHGHYDNYARYELLDSSSQALVVGHKQGFCLLDGECATTTPRYTCNDQGISVGCADAYYSNLGCQYLDVSDIPPGNYTLRVTVDPFSRIPELNENNNVVSVPVTIPSLSGAACNSATLIPETGGTFAGATAGTSSLSGSCVTDQGAPEKVYQWIPAASGQATIDTCGAGTAFDTVLYVRSGDCTMGAEMACNDDNCANASGVANASRVTFNVTAQQSYFIVVDGYGSGSGNFTLHVTPPGGGGPPDPCSLMTVIPPQGGSVTGTTSGTSVYNGTCGTESAPEKVYSWTPALSGAATIETCGAGTTFDTVAYMRSGSCATGAEVACNNDTCANSTGASVASRLTPTVTAGQTYYIFVDGNSGAAGAFGLTVTPPVGVPVSGTCANPAVVPAAGGAISGITSGVSAVAGSCGSSGGSPEQVFTWTPMTSGSATIKTCGTGTNYDTVLYVRQGTCSGPERVCNDDACAISSGLNWGSSLNLAVTAGTTYTIVVDGYGGRSGNFTLTVIPPP